jgi:hypothetical protein
MTVSGKRPQVHFPLDIRVPELDGTRFSRRALTIRLTGELPDGFKQEIEADESRGFGVFPYSHAVIDLVPVCLEGCASEEEIANAELTDGAARIIAEIVRLAQRYCECADEEKRKEVRAMLSSTSWNLGMRELVDGVDHLKMLPRGWFRAGLAALFKEGRRIFQNRRRRSGESAATNEAMRRIEWKVHALLCDWELRGGEVNWDLVRYESSWQKLFARKAQPGERVPGRIASELLCIKRDRLD